MITELLKKIENIDCKEYDELLFNLYEDMNSYSIEAVFDENKIIIGREERFYIVGDKSIGYEEILSKVCKELKSYFKKNKEQYRNLKSISYGFVDGDLYYIRKPRKAKKKQIVYTKDSFYDFDAVKLEAWLSVYLNEEGKNKYRDKIWDTDFDKISREEFEEWCDILARYFNYDKSN